MRKKQRNRKGPFLVADDLDSDVLSVLVIEGADDLPKGSLAQQLQHLIAVRNVIANRLFSPPTHSIYRYSYIVYLHLHL